MDFEKAIYIISTLCTFQALAEPHHGVDRNIYCESCLTTVKEIESLLTKVPNESREAAVKKMADAVTCKTVPFEKGPSYDKMRVACEHLLERKKVSRKPTSKNNSSYKAAVRILLKWFWKQKLVLIEIYGEHFSEAFLSKESKRLDILLCYEKTFTCVGANRLKNQNHTADVTADDIKALLQENKTNVRAARPVRVNTTKATKDEL